MNPLLSALCMVADWMATDAVCTRRHQHTTFKGHQASVELRGRLVVVYDSFDTEVLIEAASIDTFKRHDFDFLCQVVSTAEWRSICDDPSRCRICQLPDELNISHSSADEFVGMPLDRDLSSIIFEPLTPPSPIPQRQRRRKTAESFEAESSSATAFQQSHRYSLPSYDSNRKKTAKPQKLSVAKSKSTTGKKTSTASPKSDLLPRKGTAPRTMHKDGPEKALHQAVFDYITKRPTVAWMATIARYTNRESSSVKTYFQNRRDQLETALIKKEPQWKSYYRSVDFELPDGSIVPMRPSALENWPSLRWTDEDFDRVIEEDFIPHLAYIKRQNDKRRVTIPYYAHRNRRFPRVNSMDQGEDVEETGEHVRLFKFEY